MSREAEFHRLLTARTLHPAARGLMDDAAVLAVTEGALVLTHDTLVEGVHARAGDPPESYGWKLAATNLSDLAAKGAEPVACLLSYPLGEEEWDRRFLDGLFACLDEFGLPLIGGDTVRLSGRSARVFGLTAIGRAPAEGVPARSGGQVGDRLWVTGPIGEAGRGLRMLEEGATSLGLADRNDGSAVAAYQYPVPHLALGRALAGRVSAMMDVSDGLLIDAGRLAAASGCGVTIADVPVSDGWTAAHGRSADALLTAATAGDDYVLLFAAPHQLTDDAHEIGLLTEEPGVRVVLDGQPVPLPERLGWEH